MRFLRFEELPMKVRGINHRQGTFRYVELGEGDSGSLDNFNLRLVESAPDFFSPRHRHNFDQVRIQIKGEFGFDSDGVMKPGIMAFFPEGTHYGPQTSQADTVQLVMQIGGSSRNGFISEKQRTEAVAKLAEGGEFKGGRYFAKDRPSDVGVDAFQAAWEKAQGRPMVYPAKRFERPVFCDPTAMDWFADNKRVGVSHKILWNFGPSTVGLKLTRISAGNEAVLEGPASAFLHSGRCTWDGLAPNAPAKKNDVIHLKSQEKINISALEDSEWLIFNHPIFPKDET